MNSWSFYKKYFPWINFSHLQSNKLLCFWSLSCWSAVHVVVYWKAGLKKQEGHVRIRAQELGKFQFYGSELSLFPPTLQNAHCLHLCILVFFPLWLCWDYWLLAFHWKMTFVVMWCGLLNIVYVAFLVSVKSFKTLVRKIF